MNTQLVAQLQELNLSLNEARVYTALLEIGQTSAGEIIKSTGLHRSVVYETLDKLIAKKLVFTLQKKKIAFYQPQDPEKLVSMIHAQEEMAKALVPSLQNLLKSKLPEITIYQGKAEWERYWFETTAKMPEGSVNYVAGSMSGDWQKIMGPIYMEKYNQLRIKKKVLLKMIVFKKDPDEMDMIKRDPSLHEFRLIERDVKDTTIDANFNIWDDKLILVAGTADPMIIEIKNPTLVKGFQNIFDMLWALGKPLKP